MATDPNAATQSDDALYFSNSGSDGGGDTDLFNASEDPTGKNGQAKTPQFQHHRSPVMPLRYGPDVPIPFVRLTPGARRIP